MPQHMHCWFDEVKFICPRPTQAELEMYYSDDYEAYVFPEQRGSRIEQWHAWRIVQMQLNYVDRYLPDRGHLLEIGCGTGTFLYKAREGGWHVKGQDVVDKAIKLARDRYQIDIYPTYLESLDFYEDNVDAVVMWDVLEHLPSQKQSLEKVYWLLRPKGMLFFSFPNIICFDRYIFGNNWIGWDVPRHFFLYDNETIQVLLQQTGFKLVNHRWLLGGKGTFNLSLHRLLENKQGLVWLKRTYSILEAVLWPYHQLAYLLHRDPIMYYAARKADG